MSRSGYSSMLLSLMALALVPPARAGSLPVELKRTNHQVEILIGGQSFTTFYFGPESPKPYLHPLRSAEGIVVTRGFPMRTDIPGESADHPHHRAMFFAHGDVNGVDFWSEARPEDQAARVAHGGQHGSESPPRGRTVFHRLDEMREGPDSGSVRATFYLVNAEGKVIAEESEAYTFRGEQSARIIDCEFTIKALREPVKMGDTKEGTFAIRVVKALEEPAARMTDAEGRSGEKQIWGKRAQWVDYSGTVQGKKLGIAIFDHPSNPKHPTYWHARGYGLFAVNPFGEHDFCNDPKRDGSITISAGENLTFRYRVLIHNGDAEEGAVAEAYQRYVKGN